jgi:hypothetical protein
MPPDLALGALRARPAPEGGFADETGHAISVHPCASVARKGMNHGSTQRGVAATKGSCCVCFHRRRGAAGRAGHVRYRAGGGVAAARRGQESSAGRRALPATRSRTLPPGPPRRGQPAAPRACTPVRCVALLASRVSVRTGGSRVGGDSWVASHGGGRRHRPTTETLECGGLTPLCTCMERLVNSADHKTCLKNMILTGCSTDAHGCWKSERTDVRRIALKFPISSFQFPALITDYSITDHKRGQSAHSYGINHCP